MRNYRRLKKWVHLLSFNIDRGINSYTNRKYVYIKVLLINDTGVYLPKNTQFNLLKIERFLVALEKLDLIPESDQI